jgi:hypothetical protein
MTRNGEMTMATMTPWWERVASCVVCGERCEADDIFDCFLAELGGIPACADDDGNPIPYCYAHANHTENHGRR